MERSATITLTTAKERKQITVKQIKSLKIVSSLASKVDQSNEVKVSSTLNFAAKYNDFIANF